jgi:LacI family transcriptional regulator
VPADVSVVAFDASDLSRWLRPRLTSVGLPHFELGRRAVELLLDRVGDDDRHLVPMPLIERESVAPPSTH